MWVFHELSYNKFHSHADRIAKIFLKSPKDGRISGHTSPIRLAYALKEEIPEIVDFVRCDKRQELLFSYKNKGFYEKGVYGVDPSFFNIFSFNLLAGDKNTLLNNLNSVVISESLAKKYFGNINPLGKTLRVNNQVDLIVTGVMRDMPANSSIQFKILLPFDLIRRDWRKKDWKNWYGGPAFVLLKDKNLENQVNQKISNFIAAKGVNQSAPLVVIRPLTNIHFTAIKKYLYIFSASALFILLIACINFINLSTARSFKRAKEIGMRKVTGADRKTIIMQFLGESFLVSFISLLLALFLVAFFIPLMNSITGLNFSFAGVFKTTHFILIPMVIITGFAAGIYPALFLSSFQPVRVIKGDISKISGGSPLRKFLVVIQFALSILLIFGTAVIYKQINFIKHTDVGYDRDQVLKISMKGATNRYFAVLKEKLESHNNITDVSGISQDLPNITWCSSADWQGKDPNKRVTLWAVFVDYDFIKTMKIKLMDGRDFKKEVSSDKETAFIVNEEMQKQMEMDSAVGKQLKFWGRNGTIIGVVKNFHFHSLYREIYPMALMIEPRRLSAMLVRIGPRTIGSTLGFIKDTWKKTVPQVPLNLTFLDNDFYQIHKEEENTGKLLGSFSILAILTGCLGLFGLISFAAEARTKEIGIRKVFGSSISRIVVLLVKELSICIIIANVIALPIAFLFAKNWIQKFAYKAPIGIDIFIFSLLLVFIISMATACFQALKAAWANPVKSLRYE
jgi:ABC-type antimicrobial peptide transport system permease subunit